MKKEMTLREALRELFFREMEKTEDMIIMGENMHYGGSLFSKIVTSDFHLPRSVFIAQHLGLDAWGVAAPTESHPWHRRFGFWTREYLARHAALLDAWFPPDTLLGPREPTPDDWLEPSPGALP